MIQSVPALIAAVEFGGYINPFKVLPVVVLLLIFARLITWIDKDADAAHLPREMVNTGVFLAGLAGFVAFFFLPNFWVALGAMVALTVYVTVPPTGSKMTVSLRGPLPALLPRTPAEPTLVQVTSVRAAGKVSATTTPVAALAPALVTTMV